MIGIFINFESQTALESVELELEKLGGYEVGGHGPNEPCVCLCEYSVDGEDAEFTEEECVEIRKEAETMLIQKGIVYSITVSA